MKTRFLLCLCGCIVVFLKSSFYFFPFAQRVLYYFVDKIFFPQNRNSHLEVFCKKGVLSILQNSPENTCFGVLSFCEIAGQRPVYTLASGRYWQRNLISEKKNLKIINFNLETPGKKFVIVIRGVFKTQSNIYNGAFLGKQLTVKSC